MIKDKEPENGVYTIPKKRPERKLGRPKPKPVISTDGGKKRPKKKETT